MDNSKTVEIIEKLRLRQERFELKKKNRRVSFEDMCPSEKDPQENVCIFKAEKIRQRSEEWPGDQKFKPDIYKTVMEGITNHTMDDLMITYGNITFKCPLILVCCFTQIFEGSNDGTGFDLKRYGVSPKCFNLIYKWMLTEAINGHPGFKEINQNCVLEMLYASKQLKIPHLEDQCWYFLQKTAQCDENIAFELYKLSDYNLTEIQQLMLSRICKYFLTLVSTEDYLKMSVNEVCALLSLSTLGVNSEIEVFYAAVLWLNYMWTEKNNDHLMKVINCVRFNLMPSWFLISLNETTCIEQVDRITVHPEVSNLITDAIIFTATQLSYLTGTDRTVEQNDQHFNQALMPSQRRWIYDKSCSYHFCPNAEVMEYVSYEMFLYYLKRLREFGKEYWRTLDFSTSDHCRRVWKSRPNLKSR